MTEAEFRANLRQLNVMALEIGRTALLKSPCKWIDLSIAEGWSKSLEGLFCSAAREALRKSPGDPPALAWFERFPINKEDREYFKQHGQSHLGMDLERIKAARALLPKPTSVTHRMTGENAA